MKKTSNPAPILTKEQNRRLVLTILRQIADERDAGWPNGRDPIGDLLDRFAGPASQESTAPLITCEERPPWHRPTSRLQH